MSVFLIKEKREEKREGRKREKSKEGRREKRRGGREGRKEKKDSFPFLSQNPSVNTPVSEQPQPRGWQWCQRMRQKGLRRQPCCAGLGHRGWDAVPASGAQGRAAASARNHTVLDGSYF